MPEQHYSEQRPWGQFTILYQSPIYQVKELHIKPGGRLSYQYHNKRFEHWLVVAGVVAVTLDDRELLLESGQSLDIPAGAKHRAANHGASGAVLIEVQTGTYFGEDDIVRLQDDYQRI